MAGEKIVLAKLDLDVQELFKKAEDSKGKIIQLRQANSELKKSGEEGSAQFIRNEIEIRRLSSAYNLTTRAIQAQINSSGQLVSISERINDVLATEAVVKEEAHLQNQNIVRLRDQLNPRIAEEAKLIEELNKKYDANRAFMRENASETEKQVMNIGDYKNQIKEALGEMTPFQKGLQSMGIDTQRVQIGFKTAQAAVRDVKDAFGEAKQAQTEYAQAQQIATEATEKATQAQELAESIGFRYSQGLATQAELEAATTAASEAHTVATEAQTVATNAGTVATIASSNAMKIFRVALISTGIGAIVVLLGSLIAYLTSTQEGMDKVTAITRPLKAIFQGLGVVFQQVGKWLSDTFSNPQKALKDFGKLLVDQVKNRIEGLLELLPAVGKAIGLLFQGKFSEAGKTAFNAVAKVGTGVENMTDKINNAAKATGKFLDENIKRGQEIDKLNKQIEQAQINFERNQVKYNDAIDQQLLISKDTSKSFKEREAAAREIIRLNQIMGDEEAAIIQKRINLLNFERGARKATREEQQKLAELETQLDAANDRGLESRIEQSKIISGLKKEQAEASKKAAEEAQKEVAAGIEAQKLLLDEYKLVQGERAKEVDERIAFNQKVYDDTVRIANAEFANSKKTEADKTKLRIATAQAGLELMRNNSEAVVKNAEQEFQRVLSANREFLKQGELLNDDKVDHEKERLQNIADAEIDKLRTTLQNEQEFADASRAIYDKLADDKEAIDKRLADQRRAAQVIDFESERTRQGEKFQYDLEAQLLQYDTQRAEQRKAAEKAGADMIAFDQATAEERNRIEQAVQQNKMQLASQAFANMATIFGEQSAAGKAFAIAQATIDTYVAANRALATLPFPFGAIAAGATIAAGIANVKKIVSTKPPKAEKGALFTIGGKRHSEGGTMFTGADGTQFEAEQGELIGVMNRNAARHFMAFNNAFPSGGSSSPGYFAGGGTITAGANATGINTDELATKIAAATSDAMRNMPAPIARIGDIFEEGNNYMSIRNGANN